MSRPNREKEFKLADEDASTNDFINSIAKSAPKKKEEPVVDRPANNEPWTSDIYTRLNGSGEARRRGHSCSSVIVFGFAIFLMLIGAGVIVVGAIEKDQKLLPLCPSCNKLVIGMYAGGAFVILVGLIGVLAAKTRNKALAIPFCTLLSLLSLGALGLTILVVVFITDTNGLHLDTAWTSEVIDDPKSICDLQEKWQCSGFKMCCSGTITNGTSVTTGAPAPTGAPTTTGAPATTTAADTTTEAPTTAADTTTDVATTTEAETTTVAATTTDITGARHVFVVMDETTTTATTAPPSGPGTCFTSENGMWPADAAAQCVPGCASNIYAYTCEAALHTKLKDNMGIILAALIPTTLLIGAMAFFAIRMTRVERYLE